MFEHYLEKIGSAVFKHSANLKGFGFSAKNLAEKKIRGSNPRNPSFLDIWMMMMFRMMTGMMLLTFCMQRTANGASSLVTNQTFDFPHCRLLEIGHICIASILP